MQSGSVSDAPSARNAHPDLRRRQQLVSDHLPPVLSSSHLNVISDTLRNACTHSPTQEDLAHTPKQSHSDSRVDHPELPVGKRDDSKSPSSFR